MTEAAKGANRDDLRQLVTDAHQEKTEEPRYRRYMVNDSTIEKLGEILSEPANENGVLQFRDELMGFLRSLEKQGNEAYRGFYLEGWDGLGSYTFDRINRGTIHIPRLCISLFGTIQPGPLAKHLRGAASGEEADGFMPRFQILVYPDRPTKYVNIDRKPDSEAKHRAFDVFRWIDSLDPGAAGAQYDESQKIHFLRFADDAQDFFNGWREELENRLIAGRDGALIENHLAKYRSLMPSLALIFHAVQSTGSDKLGEVSLASATLAAGWCDLLEAHARRAYHAATEGDIEPAQKLADRIRGSITSPFTHRDIEKKCWSGLTGKDDVLKAVARLEERNWVKTVETQTGPQGGRPTAKVWINPAVYENGGEG